MSLVSQFLELWIAVEPIAVQIFSTRKVLLLAEKDYGAKITDRLGPGMHP